ncbi:porin [Pseudomonas laurylsulfativorans]|uniref:Porin n=1 Tax=Pseudomonas laurylsulfativorans TaxID=1943631 RepID=A0A2S3VV14_9PSED|nr:APC family permease [Pseudomonas laurylsulfativorans]POF43770.1 porin [Pseudomonas laurylsulfativorans]
MKNNTGNVELKRSLKLRDLVVYGMVFMIPIAPMAIYGYIVSDSKGMATLAYLIGMIAMLFTALSYARMSEACPKAGSVYAYASHAIGPRIGFMVGWIVLLDYILIPALCYVVAAIALEGVTAISKWIWLVAFIAFNTAINIRGIQLTARVNNVFAIVLVAVLIWFVTAGLYMVFSGSLGHPSTLPLYNPETFSPSLVMSAVSIAALSFLGFDAISTLAEESSGNAKDVGRATVIVLFLMGGLFILQTWVAGMAWPDFGSLGADKDNAFYLIANAVGGPLLKTACAVATAVSWGFSCALVAQTAISRILLNMARDGKLPSALARLHPRYQTPFISTLFVGAVSLVVSVCFISDVSALTSLVNFGALTAFFVLHLCVLNQFMVRTPSRRWFKDGVVPVLGLLIIGYIWFSLDTHAKSMGLVWVVVGVIYLCILGRRARTLQFT